MFREMRRNRQILSFEETAEILQRGTSGVLALSGDDGYPYAVPISYVYDQENSRLCFHGAKSGHKIDAVKKCEKASFCVIDQDHVVPEEYTTYFRSAVVFGRMRLIEQEDEMEKAVQAIAVKYHPDGTAESRREYIRREWGPLCMMELIIEHMTGKEAIELVRAKPC